MGMVHVCECDGCGVKVPANKTVRNEYVYPPGWHVLHWQEKDNNEKGEGYMLVTMLSYCPQCGPVRLEQALKMEG